MNVTTTLVIPTRDLILLHRLKFFIWIVVWTICDGGEIV